MNSSADAGVRAPAAACDDRSCVGFIGSRLAKALPGVALAMGIAVAPLLAAAQARVKTLPRIGTLSFGTAPSGANPDPAPGFSQGLRDLGYVEGQNILIERRYADGQPDRLQALAAELVQMKVDLILAGGPGPLAAARKATSTIPIVGVSGSDPVREGWAQSLAHPGGNVTGLTVTFPELASKYLELLKQAVPGVVRVAVLLAPSELLDANAVVKEMQAGARRLGLQLQVLEVRGPGDFDAAFSLARQQHAQGLYAIATNTVVTHRSRLAALAAKERLSSIGEFPLMAQAGFLLTYGADLDDLGRRSIVYMDKILKGARPGDLAIERPAKFQLIINLKTAKALGIKIPQSVLVRADRVIE
jgi:putative tryptophan/tyrosine transport system substrate-binding protein